MRLAIVLATALLAQSQTFEVASIKPSGPQSVRGSNGGPGSRDPTRYAYNSGSLEDFIAVAYHIDYFQISSSVSLTRQNFDLVASVPAGATRQQFRVMLQNLLSERFHLKLHIVSKEFPVYQLSVAKTGLKLKEAIAGTAVPQPSRDGFPDLPSGLPGFRTRQTFSGGLGLIRVRSQQEPMSVIAEGLQAGGRPILDKTGLTGKYDFTLEYTMEFPNAPPPDQAQLPVAPDLFTALREQLGLQLVSAKAPFDVVIVDSFDKLPIAN